jgi:sporulation protein YqfC
MENKIFRAKEAIANKLELPRDILLDLPKITILANSEINIENHKGVVIFEEEEIKINSSLGPISIYGKNFKILFIGGNTITLSGKFRSVVYEGHE